MESCPLCSHFCVPLGSEQRKKKSFLGLWRKTVKLPFFHKPKHR
jgi:hypothetical protein